MKKIIIDNTELVYKIIGSKRRRTVQIRILSADSFEITVPLKMPQTEIEQLINTRSNWILAQVKRLKHLDENPVNLSTGNGDKVLYLGRQIILSIVFSNSKRAKVSLTEDTFIIQLPQADEAESINRAGLVLKKWYIKQAADLLVQKTDFWAQEIGVRPRQISIREQKTRWGSASPRGNINYNWRIIMAPPDVVDYLVIHELCHIKMPNHSKDFWLLVGQSSPNYKMHRNWLRQQGPLLTRFLRRL